MNDTPLFSILHTSARPGQWRKVYDEWMSRAVYPERVEYVLCIDPRWGFDLDPAEYRTKLDNVLVVQNTRRRCYVDGVNLAAQGSTGEIFVVNADDQFPCECWDEEILAALWKANEKDSSIDPSVPMSPFVMEVSTGTPEEHKRGVMVMPILSRAYYRQQGWVFYIEYESMYADNDFCSAAKENGVPIVDARHLYFPHRHPMFDGKGGWSRDWSGRADAALMAQNSADAHMLGREIFAKRTRSGFPAMQYPVQPRSVALCLTGDDFRGAWVDGILSLQAHLISRGFSVLRIRSATSNVYVTREDLRRSLLNFETRADFLLWLDHDNIVTPAQFDQLLAGLEAHPEVDGVSGWCWIHDEDKKGFMPSCGLWAPDHLHWQPFPPAFRHKAGLQHFEAGGFPCFLMRHSAIEKAGDGAFLPILDSRLPHGVMGEDFAFFLRAEAGGAKFLVDPQVRVPHLKYVTVEPTFPDEGLVSAKVACMMRVKNEARWIQRTIDSVRELCGADIYVMEDGSTDATREIAIAAGAVVFDSPFVGMGLDEARDKNWLMDRVMERCSPDWILMPDGDEELEPGGCAKIRQAIESNPPCDCFALRFLYFWDSVDQVRMDGNYGKMQRQSLFRANREFRFKSYYSEGQTANQNHVGLHTSNAPGLGGRVFSLNVALLHYGYLHREDRIAKYRWILSIDPHNEGEDFYRHCVQGDLPEFPADAVYRFGGPLKLQALPKHMVPHFPGGVPGPREVEGAWATPTNAEESLQPSASSAD